MMGLNKLATAITVITAVTIAALIAEIAYVLWQRRRRFRPPARVEPQEATPPCSSSPSSPAQTETDLDLELEKWQSLHGPSRALFTIKEEEREGVESETGSSVECSAVVVMKDTAVVSASLIETMAVEDPHEVTVAIGGLVIETTPFSTPCASPAFFTPDASPSRETSQGYDRGNAG